MPAKDPLSLWEVTGEPAPAAPPLDGDAVCDVAIVGGGYTGLSTALHGAEAGLDCLVLEAGTIGEGGSGRNVGLVNAGLWLPPDEVVARLGAKRGAALVQTLGAMPERVFALIDKHAIACEATRNGTIHAAHSAAGFRDLERRAAQWQRLGAPVALLNPAETARRTGSERFAGGLLDRRAGTLNPMGYARGMARAALAAGARIATHARVTGLAQSGGGWQLDTAHGRVRARRVVLATNAYADDLWPGLRRSYTVIHFFQLATPPLGARAARILPRGEGLWDTAPIMFSLRRDTAGRLIIGSMGALHGTARGGLSHRWAARRLSRLFPGLGEVTFESAWHGRIAMTPDHVFAIHRPGEGLYAPVGYNGRGITTGTLLGGALAQLLAGRATEADLPVPVTPLRPVAGGVIRTGFYHTVFAANQLIRGL